MSHDDDTVAPHLNHLDDAYARFEQQEELRRSMQTLGGHGPDFWFIVYLGMSIAVAISYDHHHSIGYAIVHGVCNWFYVVFCWIFG